MQIPKIGNIKVKIKVNVLCNTIFINVVLRCNFQAKVKYLGQEQQQLGYDLLTGAAI